MGLPLGDRSGVDFGTRRDRWRACGMARVLGATRRVFNPNARNTNPHFRF